MGTYYSAFLCYKFRTTQYINNIVPYFIFKTFNDFSSIFFFYIRWKTILLCTLYEVINLSTASAPEASRFLAVVRYWVLSLTPPSGESLSSESDKWCGKECVTDTVKLIINIYYNTYLWPMTELIQLYEVFLKKSILHEI